MIAVKAALRPERVIELSQALTMARIRNSGRLEMTRDQSFITKTQQKEWWLANHDNAKCWLYYFGRVAVGFGMIRDGAGTLCLWPRFRGLHLGTSIYQHLKEESQGDIWIEVRKTNPASIRAAQNAGYHVLSETEAAVKMTPYD